MTDTSDAEESSMPMPTPIAPTDEEDQIEYDPIITALVDQSSPQPKKQSKPPSSPPPSLTLPAQPASRPTEKAKSPATERQKPKQSSSSSSSSTSKRPAPKNYSFSTPTDRVKGGFHERYTCDYCEHDTISAQLYRAFLNKSTRKPSEEKNPEELPSFRIFEDSIEVGEDDDEYEPDIVLCFKCALVIVWRTLDVINFGTGFSMAHIRNFLRDFDTKMSLPAKNHANRYVRTKAFWEECLGDNAKHVVRQTFRSWGNTFKAWVPKPMGEDDDYMHELKPPGNKTRLAFAEVDLSHLRYEDGNYVAVKRNGVNVKARNDRDDEDDDEEEEDDDRRGRSPVAKSKPKSSVAKPNQKAKTKEKTPAKKNTKATRAPAESEHSSSEDPSSVSSSESASEDAEDEPVPAPRKTTQKSSSSKQVAESKGVKRPRPDAPSKPLNARAREEEDGPEAELDEEPTFKKKPKPTDKPTIKEERANDVSEILLNVKDPTCIKMVLALLKGVKMR